MNSQIIMLVPNCTPQPTYFMKTKLSKINLNFEDIDFSDCRMFKLQLQFSFNYLKISCLSLICKQDSKEDMQAKLHVVLNFARLKMSLLC